MRPDIVMDDFARYRGQTFEVLLGEDQVFPIVLETLEPIQPSPRPGGSFSLTFVGPLSPILNQGMYDVRCGDETWLLFIVPLGPKGDVAHYEAVFN
jgi:hypothetical protein